VTRQPALPHVIPPPPFSLQFEGPPVNRHFVALGLLLLCTAAPVAAGDSPAVGAWNFDGNLSDRSGRGNDAFAPTPDFVAGHSGQGLKCNRVATVVPDSPDLRPAPGLRIDLWVKVDALGRSFDPLLMKNHEYQLRIDPPGEGGYFAFFLDLNGWEPRVRSKTPVKVDTWYHVSAGWDGQELWLDVDGQRSSVPRRGTPQPLGEPLQLGLFDGVLDELRIENPQARPSGVAQWLFEGDLRDASEHGHHLSGKDPEFAAVPGGKAFKATRSVQVPSSPDLQLAPGFRLDCSVCFEKLPPEGRQIVVKNNEYQLRLNSQKEGGGFALFLNLNGWEPRVTSAEKVEAGKWYRLTAAWDGFVLSLDVNGQRSRTIRSGLAQGTDNPLVIGASTGLIDNLKIENPRLPTLQVRDARQEHALLLAGRPEKFSTVIRNIGLPAGQVTALVKLPAGVRNLGPATYQLGELPTGGQATLDWSVQAERPVLGHAEIQITAPGIRPLVARHPLVFLASEAGPPPSASAKLPAGPGGDGKATTYYIDSVAGDNARAGTSPETAWKDFAQINGRVLGPGERLLLCRGSMFTEELVLSARGTADNWAEIGTYGVGPRPIIRRNWDIDDRCALVRDPDYLRIRGLVVCYAGKGLIVTYTQLGHRGLLIEDCIAHHIEGLYRFNAHGIPEWLNRRGPAGDGGHSSSGIGINGATAADVVLRNCEMFQCSSGYFVRGDDAVVDRVYCHDNIVHNTSPHPFLVSARRALLVNSIFDASGWHASAGTMGIMLGDIHGLIIRNCYFRNQPDSGSHDEGGIDFENRGNGCLIDHCTFENNAGAAIEVLGLQSPQTTNIEIRNSRFIQNNTAKKLGPGEIFVWGRSRDPAICCSNGVVRGNGYVLLPGVQFFVNEKPDLTAWTLADNTQYASIAEIDRGMPFNRPPVVDAGPDVRTNQATVALAGRVQDDGQPQGRPLAIAWEVLSGPGSVTFANAHAAATTATFAAAGDYVLRLVADDGELWSSRMAVVHILPPGTTVRAAWEFNKNLDKEGWTEVNPGTQTQTWPDAHFPTTSHPVKIVAGGYYVLAIENSTDAHLLSAEPLGVELTGNETVTLRFQNHTPATQMRLRFTTDGQSDWSAAQSHTFAVTPNDNAPRTYTINMMGVPGWKGRLKQLRIDLATGAPLTGTCRFDYIWITAPAGK